MYIAPAALMGGTLISGFAIAIGVHMNYIDCILDPVPRANKAANSIST